MTYCTPAEATAAGASGTPAEVLAAIAGAEERVDRYTGDHFEPRVETVTLRVKGDYAPSRRLVQAITEVSVPVPGSAPRIIPATAYLAEPHGIRFRAWGSDILVAGAEPWRGGWANLIGPLDGAHVTVTGTFGWAAVPDAVREATARLAAMLAPATWQPSADAEGDPVGVPPAEAPDYRTPPAERVAAAGRLERTTGDAEADRLLSDFIAAPVRFG